LLAELKAGGVAMYALSNYPPWYEMIDERLKLSRYLELRFVSCRTGVRKPAPEAYLGPCRALGRAPAECLFIDDRATNCDAARAQGLHALHFDGSAVNLRARLGELGLLSR
jgi:HAD superfamily hydrolase (TIGR01509 family)